MGHKWWLGGCAVFGSIAAVMACVGDQPIVPTDGGNDALGDAVNSDGGSCTNTTSDPNNCGVCGHLCANGFSCKQGVCGNAVTVLGAGANHTCVTLASADVYCWGADNVGQSGTTPAPSVGPTLIPRDVNASSFTSLFFSGGFDHLCAVRGNNNVSCWGNDVFGQLGDHQQSNDGGPIIEPTPNLPIKANFQAPPITVNTLGRGPTATHTCGVDDGGVILCWGDDTAGESSVLADASTTQSCNAGNNTCLLFPFRATNEVATQVAVGNQYSCSLDGSGTVRCWGGGRTGQLGNNKHGLCLGCGGIASVVALPGAASYVATGDSTTCVILASDGSVQCWGSNETEELGYAPIGADGGPVDPCCSIDCGFSGGHPRCEDHPIAVKGMTNAVVLAMGTGHVCALDKSGSVWCWGANDKGQLGIGSNDTNPSPTPTKISTISNVVDIVSGANHTCALLKDSTVWCWGLNDKGQLGAGTSNSSSPVQVSTLPH